MALKQALEPLRNLVWRRANRLTSLIPPPPYGGACVRPSRLSAGDAVRVSQRALSMCTPPRIDACGDATERGEGLEGVQKKVFIVCANPIGSASFSHAIADSAAKGLAMAGHEVALRTFGWRDDSCAHRDGIAIHGLPASLLGPSSLCFSHPLRCAYGVLQVRRINLYEMPAEVSQGNKRGFEPLLSAQEREGYFLEHNQPQVCVSHCLHRLALNAGHTFTSNTTTSA